MAEPVDLRDPLEHRLEAIERRLGEFETAITDVETTLVVVVERLNRLLALYRSDHYGVGRGGVQEGDA